MSQSLASDDPWEAIEPLLPKERSKPRGGRPRIPDCAALGGTVFVLRTGTPCADTPQGTCACPVHLVCSRCPPLHITAQQCTILALRNQGRPGSTTSDAGTSLEVCSTSPVP